MSSQRPVWLKQLDTRGFTSERILLQGHEHPLGNGARVVKHGSWMLVTPNPADRVERLEHGKFFSVNGVDYVFGDFFEAREPAMEAAIAADRGNPNGLQVYADWLLEHGDPLGERILRPRTAFAEKHWLEGLDQEVEVGWRDGLIDRVVIRESTSNRDLEALRRTLTRVLALRAACLLRELVIDFQAGDPRLAAPALRGPKREETIVIRAAEFAARLPPLLALESLSLGYCFTPARPAAIVVPQNDPRFPRLDPGPVFTWAARAVFEVLEATALDGAKVGARVAAAGMRLRTVGSRVMLASLEEPRGAWGWASASEVGGRILLCLNREMKEIEVNGRIDVEKFLLPGDVIEVFCNPRTDGPAARLRFELER